jgi:hypothetical protein
MLPNGLAMGSSAKKAINLSYSANLANKRKLYPFNSKPELLPIAIVVSSAIPLYNF